MTDEKDPPIEPQPYLGGVKVVDIGDVRVARGMSRRHYSSCQHRRMVYDGAERRIWCQDCERDVEAFDAFKGLIEGYNHALVALERREESIASLEKFKLRTIAARKMEEAWRHKNMVPACPHCHNGLFPEDFKSGMSMLGKDYARGLLAQNIKQE